MKTLQLFAFFVLSSMIISGFGCKKETILECGTQQNGCPNCTMEANPGPCLAAFIRYYFDQTEGKCKEFTWGGCGEVPFETLEECEACDCVD